MLSPTFNAWVPSLTRTGALAALILLLGSTACRDATVSDALRPEEAKLDRRRISRIELSTENSEWMRRFEADTGADCYTRRFRDADTLGSSDGLNLPSCPSQMVVTPNAGDGTYLLWHGPDATGGNGSADSLVVTFSQPVGMLAILRDGTHSCYDTTVGEVVAYGADGAELGRSPFNVIQTCSDALPTLREDPAATVVSAARPRASGGLPYTSPYAEYAEAVLPIPGGVTRLVFLPPSVWDFTFVDPYFPDHIQQYARQGRYTLIFRAALQTTELKLRCVNPDGQSDSTGGTILVRGQWVACKASVTPATSVPLAVSDWSFNSSGNPFTLSRSGVDDSTYARDSTTWSGPMFTSGRVTVRGTIAGQNRVASARVDVTARPWNTDWIDSTRWTVEEVPHPYADPPKADSELGLNRAVARRDYHLSYVRAEQGPNQSLLAFSRFPFILSFEVSVHSAAMQVGSKFYDMQPRSATGGFCSAMTMVNSKPLVKKHEGFAPVDTLGPRFSHTFIYKRWFRKTLNASTEAFFAKDDSSFFEGIERLRASGESIALDSSLAITHRSGSNPFTLSCRFNYDPAVRF